MLFNTKRVHEMIRDRIPVQDVGRPLLTGFTSVENSRARWIGLMHNREGRVLRQEPGKWITCFNVKL
jgi:hypothetical protein